MQSSVGGLIKRKVEVKKEFEKEPRKRTKPARDAVDDDEEDDDETGQVTTYSVNDYVGNHSYVTVTVCFGATPTKAGGALFNAEGEKKTSFR